MCGLYLVATNNRGSSLQNFWFYCKEGLDIKIVFSTKQQITVEVSTNNKIFKITMVYASTSYVASRRLLTEFLSIYDSNIPWCFLGDFNNILGAHEKRGGRAPKAIACEEYARCSVHMV